MIYVMSDIHGNLRRFQSVLDQIRLQKEDTLYILGDVVDRHPEGIRILRKIMVSRNMKMLLGNHEYMLLRALGEPYEPTDRLAGPRREEAVRHWYRNGGEVTHLALDRLGDSYQQEIFEYLKSLPLNIDLTVNGQNYKLVHGAPVEMYPLYPKPYTTSAHFAVWKRWEDEDKLPGDYTMIYGHTPTRHFQDCVPMKICYGEHKIGIDCGSGYPELPGSPFYGYGRLACLRLDDGAEFYSQEPYE